MNLSFSKSFISLNMGDVVSGFELFVIQCMLTHRFAIKKFKKLTKKYWGINCEYNFPFIYKIAFFFFFFTKLPFK